MPDSKRAASFSAMSAAHTMIPLEKTPDCDVEVVGSKSYTNRALIVAALSSGTSTLSGALFSDDTRYMAASLRALGVSVEADEAAGRLEVIGANGRVPAKAASC